MRIFDLAASLPWAITEAGLRQIFAIAAREDLNVELAEQIRLDRAARPAAVATRRGDRLDGTRDIRVRDGVAIIEINGPIVRRADLFSDISGATSVETLARDLQVALDAPLVEAIVLAVDSPGGEVTGINEFAEMVAAARGRKRIWAYVEGLGASAAYWIASAAERIIADPTAGLGSIGVVMAVPDPEKRSARDIEIVSSQSPRKRPDVTTEDGRAQLQTIVDDIAGVFVSAVSRNRGVSEETVLHSFGQGGMLIGRAAVKARLADQLGSFERTLRDIRTSGQSAKKRGALSGQFWTELFRGTQRLATAEMRLTGGAQPRLAPAAVAASPSVAPRAVGEQPPTQRIPSIPARASDDRAVEIADLEREIAALVQKSARPMSDERHDALLGMAAQGRAALPWVKELRRIERAAVAGTQMTVERRRALLGMTELGRRVLERDQKKARERSKQ